MERLRLTLPNALEMSNPEYRIADRRASSCKNDIRQSYDVAIQRKPCVYTTLTRDKRRQDRMQPGPTLVVLIPIDSITLPPATQ